MSETATDGTGRSHQDQGAAPGSVGSDGSLRDSWLADAPDDLVALAGAKGWTSPAHVLQGYQGLEKLLGAERAGRTVVLPKGLSSGGQWADRGEGADEAERAAFYHKLGRPETAEGYGLDKIEGADPSFSGKAAAVMHKLGLSQSQAEGLAAWWAAEAGAMRAADDEAFARRSQREFEDLQAAWGREAGARIETARRYARTAGFDEAQLNAIEKAIGTRAMLERFDAAGKALMEDSPPRGGSDAMPATPQAAGARLTAMLADPAKVAALMDKSHPGHAAAVEEKARLEQIIAGVGAA